MSENLIIIGIDCGDSRAIEKLIQFNNETLANADVIYAGRAVFERLIHHSIFRTKMFLLPPSLEECLTIFEQFRLENKKVVVLANGDPLFYGLGSSLELAGQRDFASIPAVTSMQAACARMLLPWNEISCVSLHGRGNLQPLNEAILAGKTVCVLTDFISTPSAIARYLLARGQSHYQAQIFTKMGEASEERFTGSLDEIRNLEFAQPAIMFLMPDAGRKAPHPGLQGIIGAYSTKLPVRGAILELLASQAEDIIWDIGAGSGAIGIETCALAYRGRVIAVERNWQRCLDIQGNRSRFGAVNLEIVLGTAPDILENLPRPQGIFIGGGLSGGNASAILGQCAQKLVSGGRLAIGCILLESVRLCAAFLEDLGWNMQIFQLAAFGSEKFGAGHKLVPFNPVFLLGAIKP